MVVIHGIVYTKYWEEQLRASFSFAQAHQSFPQVYILYGEIHVRNLLACFTLLLSCHCLKHFTSTMESLESL